MRVIVLREAGYDEAMLGLSLSYGQPIENMHIVADKLAHKDSGHNKFLESIAVWLDITAPRYWWQQEATYRIGITRQSESTMHTILKRPLTQADFEVGIPYDLLFIVNTIIKQKDWCLAKRVLPESFLQRRIICTNYKALRHICKQRGTHRLSEWQFFITELHRQVKYNKWLPF